MSLQWVAEPPTAGHRHDRCKVPNSVEQGAIGDLQAVYSSKQPRGAIDCLLAWLDEHPASWAIIGTYEKHDRTAKRVSGFSARSLESRGIPIARHKGVMYAQSRAKAAMPLLAALHPKSNEKLPPILCLIDGYPGHIQEGREGSGSGVMAEGTKRKLMAIDSRPGRWALIGERGLEGKASSGLEGAKFKRLGYEVQTLNGKTYARKPSPDGRPLTDWVTPTVLLVPDAPLPMVEPDEFGWSPTEINNALATARAWLFPIEGNLAA